MVKLEEGWKHGSGSGGIQGSAQGILAVLY
jgi:hypothetical protein